jgi:hypothetical protein
VEWDRARASVHPDATVEVIAKGFADNIGNGPQAWWGTHAAMQYPAAERLHLVVQPTLLIRTRDGRSQHTADRSRELLPKARSVEQVEIYGSDLFESAATQVSTLLREFLRG